MSVRLSTKRALLATVSLVVAALLLPASVAFGGEEAGFGTRFADVTTADGVVLKAMVLEPGTPGPHPAAVLISAWGGGMTQNVMPAKTLADKGYIVVAYGARGFGESGGEVQVAGEPDIADVSTVLDWTVANTATDPARIGVGGVSYGAGIGLLASAKDARIRAVASLSGWADLVGSLNQNDTRHGLTARVLYESGKANGHLSAESDKMLSGIFDPNLSDAQSDVIKAWAKSRSPIDHVDEINRNQPAVLALQTWSETVFQPGQMVDLFHRLTGPKRAEFLPGDHAAAESGGLLGLPSETWNSVYRWFDAYVAGTDDSIKTEYPIVVTPRPGHQAAEPRPTWEAAVGSPVRSFLGPKSGSDGSLLATPARPWTSSVAANQDTVANGGLPLVTYTLEALSGEPPTAMMGLVDRNNGAVWTGPKQSGPVEIRGAIKAHLLVTPPTAKGTVVAYVYDVDQLGIGRLINYLPYSWTSATPGVAFPADFDFSPTAYSLAAGHHLSLVTDSKDALFVDQNSGSGRLAFSSTTADPSFLDIPVVR